jgi:diadenosine tetraphosphate (Ap4A) HIT family hydrolase
VSLEILWAGWRAAYVTTAAEVPDGEGSIFTRILASGLPDTETHVLWRGPTCFAICNAFPYVSGHLLLMPYREVADLEDLAPEEHAELWAAVRDAVVAVKAAYRPEGVNVGMNLGRPAGAGVPGHLHVHVLPRWNGDTNFMTAVGGTRVIPEDLASTAAKLRAAWPVAPTAP